MGEVSNSGRTILFVSHDLNALSNLCNKACVLKGGQVNYLGDLSGGITHYQGNEVKDSIYIGTLNSHKPIYIKGIGISNQKGEICSTFFYDQSVYIDFDIQINDLNLNCDLFFIILDDRKRRITAFESNDLKPKMRFELVSNFLVRGQYSIYAFINQPNIARIDEAEDVCTFGILDNGSPMLKHGGYDYGNIFGKGKWIYP